MASARALLPVAVGPSTATSLILDSSRGIHEKATTEHAETTEHLFSLSRCIRVLGVTLYSRTVQQEKREFSSRRPQEDVRDERERQNEKPQLLRARHRGGASL